MKLFEVEKKYIAWKAVGGSMTPCNYRNIVKVMGFPVYQSPEKRVLDYVPTERKRKGVWVKIG